MIDEKRRMLFVLFPILLATVRGDKPPSFDLPALIVHVEQPYLIRKVVTKLSCQIAPGWSEARIHDVQWFKDGVHLRDTIAQWPEDFVHDGPTLKVTGGKRGSEGDYQCAANITGVRLSNKLLIRTQLVSSPVKLRRARITKFERISKTTVRVKQGQVARLPCTGLPDVIPGPPEICFERDGYAGCLGSSTTGSGIQIALAQPTDSGNYYCVVRNTFTNQTRRSPVPVVLEVESIVAPEGAKLAPPALVPRLIYPAGKGTSEDRPIIIDAVANQDVLLECVFAEAKIVWHKHNSTIPSVSMTSDTHRLRQIWGNLRIRNIQKNDAGVYSCHGFDPFVEPNFSSETHPRVHYQLVVHAPSDVELLLRQNPFDKRNWELSCLANNLRYEIPMVFVNATPLIDAIEQMGVPSHTNFYTNPINVTMQVKQPFTASIQCISRPAMEEAEIYGSGLERGRSKNLYILGKYSYNENLIEQGPDNITVVAGKSVEIPCIVQTARAKQWRKNGRPVAVFGGRTRVIGSFTLEIFNVSKEDEGLYTCLVTGEDNRRYNASGYLTVISPTTTTLPITTTTTEPLPVKKTSEIVQLTDVGGFVTGADVRLQWSVLGDMADVAKITHFIVELKRNESNAPWIQTERVDAHVRATTIRRLVPGNDYQFRVKMFKEDQQSAISNTTNWMRIAVPEGDTLPAEPHITDVRAVSASALRVSWRHSANIPNARARHFVVLFSHAGSDRPLVARTEASESELVLEGLLPNTPYQVTIVAENHAGRSQESDSFLARTLEPGMEADKGLLALSTRAISNLLSEWSIQNILIVCGTVIVCLLFILICCIICCNIAQTHNSKITKAANGKFVDTSYRIFNQQKVMKSKLYSEKSPSSMFTTGREEQDDELSPLRSIREPNGCSVESLPFKMRGMPNLYGEGGDDEIHQEEEDVFEGMDAFDAVRSLDMNYVNCPRIDGGLYSTQIVASARCYSPDSGTSHEMILSSAHSAGVQSNSPPHRPSPVVPSLFRPTPADSLLYSPAGTAASSLADTSGGAMSTGSNGTRPPDSPTNPPTESSDQGVRCGGSSRDSQVSSTDGRFLQTFKGSSSTSQSPPMQLTFMAASLRRDDPKSIAVGE